MFSAIIPSGRGHAGFTAGHHPRLPRGGPADRRASAGRRDAGAGQGHRLHRPAHRLVDDVASLYSVNRLTAYLHSLGHRAPKSAVADYVEWFEDAFFLFTVRVFDASLTRAHANPKKIYCIDHALARSVGSGILVNAGHLLENLVFTALRRRTPEIRYFKGANGREVDFVARMPDNSRLLVQVCESLAEPRTRKREVTALRRAMAELGLRAGTIVTRDEEETIAAGADAIDVVPAWRFLLDVG